MTTTLNINTSSTSPAPSVVTETSADNSLSNAFSIGALSVKLTDLLRHLQDEIEGEQQALTTTSSEEGETSSSTEETVSPYALAQMMAQLMGDNSKLETVLAQEEQNMMTQQTQIQDTVNNQQQTSFDDWKKSYHKWQHSIAHQSTWQKIFGGVSKVFHYACKEVDKTNPITIIGNKLEDKLEDKLGLGSHFHLDLETAVHYGSKGMDAMNSVIQDAAVGLGDQLGSLFGNKLAGQICGEIIVAAALAVATGGVEAVGDCAVEAYAEAGVEASVDASEAAGEAGSQAARAGANASDDVSFGDKFKDFANKFGSKMKERVAQATERGGASANEDAANEAKTGADEGAANESKTAADDNSITGQMKKLFTMSHDQSRSVFIETYVLQHTNFAMDVAKVFTKDPDKQLAIAMTINTCLGVANGVAGYQYVSSFSAGQSLFDLPAYKLTMLAESIGQGFKAAGDMGVGIYDLELADEQDAMGTMQANIDMGKTMSQITSQQIQETQKSLSGILSQLSDNISSLANALPLEMAAAAKLETPTES